jgi:hypothetical protein
MAAIHVPQEAQSLLALCRKHECGPTEQAGPSCFETYADLIVFAASYGFAELNGRAPNRKTKFLERPNPIDLGVFKNDKRYPQLLLMALATSKDRNVVRDEETICRLVEDFASVGCSRLTQAIESASGEGRHLAIAKVLVQTSDVQI